MFGIRPAGPADLPPAQCFPFLRDAFRRGADAIAFPPE